MKDAEEEIAELRAQIISARERRVAAQKEASSLPMARRSLERVERDFSSSTTTEVESLKDRIVELRGEIIECAHGMDLVRMRVESAGIRYRRGTAYSRMTEALNAEGACRQAILEDPRSDEFDLVLPSHQEVSN